MCQCCATALFEYLFDKSKEKSSNGTLDEEFGELKEVPIPLPPLPLMHKRKSSHHFQVDYSTLLEEDENKENVEVKSNVMIERRESRKKRNELQFQQLENSVQIYCEYCRRSISQKNVMFCMMDRCFCSEHCRKNMFSQPFR